MHRHQKLCVSMILTFASLFVFMFHGIKKQSSCVCLLEQLESSGTKTLMTGPIVRQLHVCVDQTNKHTDKLLVMNFEGGGGGGFPSTCFCGEASILLP